MAIKTQSQLNNEIQTSFPNNNAGLITPAILRAFQQDMSDTMFAGASAFVNVLAYGADPTCVNDSTSAFSNANAAVTSLGGGVIFVPPGSYIVKGLMLGANVTIQGSGRTASWLFCGGVDVSVITAPNTGQIYIRDLSVVGKGAGLGGVFTDTSGSAPSNPAVLFQASGGGIYDVQILGGRQCLSVSCSDAVFFNVICDWCYGQTLVLCTGQNWWYHCKFDHSATGATALPPYSAWAGTTPYVAGNSVTVAGNAVLVCTVGGTSGSVQPTTALFGVDIHDGSVTWRYQQNSVGFASMTFSTPAGENHVQMVDMSGPFTASVVMNTVGGGGSLGVCILTDCVLSVGAAVSGSGSLCLFTGCEISGVIAIDTSYAGKTSVQNNFWVASGGGVSIGASVKNFIISDNLFNAGSVTVATGASDHYVINSNVGATITDNGSGSNKSVTGNVS